MIQAQLQLSHPGFALHVDVTLPGQGVSALLGPSGSGKTSCLRALAGLDHAKGRVVVNGEVWQDDASATWRPTHQRALAYVFQDSRLFDHLTVRGNLEFGLKRVPAAQRRVALDQAVALLGIGHLLARAPARLSGGERQRVGIARALATSPRLMLMDEPLASLDAARKAEILPYLEGLHRDLDIPVIYVSHALDEVARLADTVVLLAAGQVCAVGPTADLLTRLDLSLTQGDTAGAILHATVRAHEPDDHLTQADFCGGQLYVPRQPLAPGAPLRIRIQARDVSLSLTPPQGTSILNILPVSVTGLREDSPGQVMVALEAGGSPLLARITRRSARVLELEVGSRVYAQVKGVAILG